jgi:hypothetical protein
VVDVHVVMVDVAAGCHPIRGLNPAMGLLHEEGLDGWVGGTGGRGVGEELPLGEDGGFRRVTFNIFGVPGLRTDCFSDSGK